MPHERSVRLRVASRIWIVIFLEVSKALFDLQHLLLSLRVTVAKPLYQIYNGDYDPRQYRKDERYYQQFWSARDLQREHEEVFACERIIRDTDSIDARMVEPLYRVTAQIRCMKAQEDDRVSPIEFRKGLLPVGVWLVATFAVLVVSGIALGQADGPIGLAFMLGGFIGIALVAWLVLRWEGVTISQIGAGRRHLLPGTLLAVGLYAVLNILGLAYLWFSGGVSFEPAAEQAYWIWALLAIVYIVVGTLEEFAARGYLQNKLIAVFGGGRARVLKAVAIVAALVLFVAIHLPQRMLIQGITDPQEIAATFVMVVILGLFLAVLYEYSRNIFFVGVVHGGLNFPLFITADIPLETLGLLSLILAFGVAWWYRRWASRIEPTDFAPQVQHHPVP